jgi:hypothetical protein
VIGLPPYNADYFDAFKRSAPAFSFDYKHGDVCIYDGPTNTFNHKVVAARPHDAPEWLWYGEADGKEVITFGRWPRHGAQWRYTYAEVQPTEHDRASVSAIRDNLQQAWAALSLIRETVETLGPVGSVQNAEHLDGPTFMHEAEALVAGIRKLVEKRDG